MAAVLRLMVALLVVVMAPSVLSSAWNSLNNPSVFSNFLPSPVYRLGDLPTSGGLSVTPWTDTYWPSYLSGIANRWASDNPQCFNYTLNTQAQLEAMSRDDLLLLSPAEKYDIYIGRYDYPTVHAEWQRTSPQDESWEGICHGWTVASLQYTQPNPIDLPNTDGTVTIPFASSDIKALLDYFTAEYAEEQTSADFIGDRCNYDLEQDPAKANVSACADLNAGAFHVLVSNMLSKSVYQGFVGDRDRGIQVWNQPIFNFVTQQTGQQRDPSKGSAPGTVREVFVEGQISYTVELQPQYDIVTDPPVESSDYRYWLELDGDDNILGGSYESYERLDFAWMQTSVTPFSGFFKPVQVIYEAATKNTSRTAAAPLPVVPTRRLPAIERSELKGELKSVKDAQGNYPNNHMMRWSIVPPEGVVYSAVEFQIVDFSTERYRDKVRIFEGADGTGALVAVYHGDRTQQPTKPLMVHSNGAVVSFRTDQWGTDTGFTIRYRGIM